ncbi:biotin transport system ATP-binding protein [Sanguibacter gelidistatuariae]|uniref:Biotin transport system ATP-binding protein n=1 Tax=Sanguibacter gelidistatuariae TaxID=1814289 RepID=A0A1G6TQ65_9MICO|nr:energy-coupling factor ABC transporter ATP-binding protein [Sanguibacter gelidistatuariae]SDD31322.1 biotin transport system ATP-binding protein [Sanguibacter gelidistatuariae]
MIEFLAAHVAVAAPAGAAPTTAPPAAHAGAATVTPTALSGEVTILEPTTVTLTERRVAVIGANGSGKSTFARLINGLVLPTSGYVRVNGLDSHDDGRAVRRQVGFVFSDADAQLVMPTPLEDVTLSLRRLRLGRRERADRAREILDRFALTHLADVSVHALSGGQKQLLALAGVLATEPAVLVCDEPTTLLDLRWRTRVNDLLAGLDQQLLHVTHDLEAAARADRVLVIDRAHVVFDGDPASAVAHYRELMTGQAQAPDEP